MQYKRFFFKNVPTFWPVLKPVELVSELFGECPRAHHWRGQILKMLEIADGERGAAGDGNASNQRVTNIHGAAVGLSLGGQLCRMRSCARIKHGNTVFKIHLQTQDQLVDFLMNELFQIPNQRPSNFFRRNFDLQF